jgi:hypothetical protein
MKHLSLSILACLLFFNNTCDHKSTQTDVVQIAFGSGGGVTGFVKRYELSKSGKLTLSEGRILASKEGKLLKMLSKKEMREISKKLELLKPQEIKFNQPGNMSYFLEVVKSDNTKNEIMWGGSEQAVPAKVKEFYDFLMTKVK